MREEAVPGILSFVVPALSLKPSCYGMACRNIVLLVGLLTSTVYLQEQPGRVLQLFLGLLLS